MGLANLLMVPGLGSSSVAPLDIKASVGTSTSPTSTGTKAVTGVGFEPKVVMPFTVGLPIGTAASQQAPLGFGAGVSSSNRAAIGVNSQSGVTTSDTERSHTNANILSIPLLGSVNNFLVSDLSTLGTDGFTLNWSTVESTERILNHICLGGADLEVSLTQQLMNSTNAAQSFAHGLSGAPTGLLMFSVGYEVAPPSTTSAASFNIGLWAGDQYSACISSKNGLTTTSTQRFLSNNTAMSFFNNVGAFIARSMVVDSVDSSDVNVSYSGSGNPQRYFWMLAIRGAKCQTGTFDLNNSLSPLTINTPGITPKLFLPIFIQQGSDLINSVQNGLAFAIGASDGISNVSCGITDANAVTTTNTRRYQSSSTLVEYSHLGTKAHESTASFSGESVVITPTTLLNNDWGQGCYFVVGS